MRIGQYLQPLAEVDTTLNPVEGGSGQLYKTIADAVAGESEDVQVFAPPQPGTTNGILVLPAGASPVDGAFKDYWVVNTDLTPSNGLVCRYARVAQYTGVTRTAILDTPWDFSAESEVTLVQPVRVGLLADIDESPVIAKNIELNLSGHRLRGSLDFTGGVFSWVRGAGGYVTNGIQKTNLGVLRVHDCVVSQRDATIYALLMTNASNLGRCDLFNSRFQGRVAGRRGRSGWEIRGCKNLGTADAAKGIPYALVESVAAVSITLTQLDVEIQSEFAGAMVYSENSITGATAYVSIMGNIHASTDFYGMAWGQRRCNLWRAFGTATLTVTVTTGIASLSFSTAANGVNPILEPSIPAGVYLGFAVLAAESSTGSVTVDYAGSATTMGQLVVSAAAWFPMAGLVIEGTSDTTATVTLDSSTFSTFPTFVSNRGRIDGIVLRGRVTTGTVRNRMTIIGRGAIAVTAIAVFASQDAGAPTIDMPNGISAQFCETLSAMGVDGLPTISVGTYTVVGLTGNAINNLSTFPTISGAATLTVSGTINVRFAASAGTSLFRWRNDSGGTFTISATQNYAGGRFTTFELARAAGTSTVVNSGNVTVSHAVISNTAALLARALAATATARCTGVVAFRACEFESAITMLESSAVGAVAEGPSSLSFDDCVLTGAVTDRTGAGTFTWAAATWRYRNCHVEGLWTFTGTSFSTIETFETYFNGNISGKSISATGTRPATYRFWAGGFRARFDDLLPEWIEVWGVLPADDVFVQGQPVTVNATQEADTAIGTSTIEAVSLLATAVGDPTIMVKDGRAFVNVEAGVASGDLLVLDTTTPARCDTAILGFVPGQTVGFALEAAGATVAGKAYTAVRIR